MKNTTFKSIDIFFHQLKGHMVGIIKEAYGESVNRVVGPAVEWRYKKFRTIYNHSMNINLKAGFLFIDVLLLLYKFSRGKL